MKKTLLATAVIGALGASAAAQALLRNTEQAQNQFNSSHFDPNQMNENVIVIGLFGSVMIGLQVFLYQKINTICERLAKLEAKS